jgi:hypothetical protein
MPSKPSGYYDYHLLQYTKTLHYASRIYSCVPYGSHNKQRLFPLKSINRLVFVAEM